MNRTFKILICVWVVLINSAAQAQNSGSGQSNRHCCDTALISITIYADDASGRKIKKHFDLQPDTSTCFEHYGETARKLDSLFRKDYNIPQKNTIYISSFERVTRNKLKYRSKLKSPDNVFGSELNDTEFTTSKNQPINVTENNDTAAKKIVKSGEIKIKKVTDSTQASVQVNNYVTGAQTYNCEEKTLISYSISAKDKGKYFKKDYKVKYPKSEYFLCAEDIIDTAVVGFTLANNIPADCQVFVSSIVLKGTKFKTKRDETNYFRATNIAARIGTKRKKVKIKYKHFDYQNPQKLVYINGVKSSGELIFKGPSSIERF